MAPIAERYALEEFDGMSKVVSWSDSHVGSMTSSKSEPWLRKRQRYRVPGCIYRCLQGPTWSSLRGLHTCAPQPMLPAGKPGAVNDRHALMRILCDQVLEIPWHSLSGLCR